MSTFRRLFVGAFLCLVAVSWGQDGNAGSGTWVRIIQSSDRLLDAARSKADRRGDRIVAAAHAWNGGYDVEGWLLSIRSDGNLLGAWKVVSPDTHHFDAEQVLALGDGGLLAVGYTTQSNFAVKVDASGQVVWQKKISGGDSYLHSVTSTQDGGFVFAGAVVSFPIIRGWLLKTNGFGQPVWSKSYRSATEDVFHSVRETANGDLIVSGGRRAESQDPRAFILRLDSEGKPRWSRAFGSGLITYGSDAIETPGGDIAVVATQPNNFSFPDADYDAYVARFTGEGKTVWSRRFSTPGLEELNSISLASDGGFNIAGNLKGNGITSMSLWMVRLASDGSIVWERALGGTPDRSYFGSSVFSLVDGSSIVLGTDYIVDPAKNQVTGGTVIALRADANGKISGSPIPSADVLIPSITGFQVQEPTFTVTEQGVSVSDGNLQVSTVSPIMTQP